MSCCLNKDRQRKGDREGPHKHDGLILGFMFDIQKTICFLKEESRKWVLKTCPLKRNFCIKSFTPNLIGQTA